MEWEDALKILFGTGLGLMISLAQSWLASSNARKRAEKLLKLELPAIKKAIEGLSRKKVISLTDLPSLNFLGASELASLPETVAAHAYELVEMLKRAELSRKVASGLLDNQDSPEFKVHSTVYVEYLEATRACLDQLCSEFNC